MRWTPKQLKFGLNLYPPYWFTGIRITHIDPQWREMRIAMKLRLYNRNAVGTHFGGSLFAMTDPHHMLMLMHILGRDYVVWDQAATIHFQQPGRGLVRTVIRITDQELAEIYRQTKNGAAFRPEYELAIRDEEDELVATVKKVLYVRKKSKP